MIRKALAISFLAIFSIGCTEPKIEGWRQPFINQEESRVVTVEENYEYSAKKFVSMGTSVTFETFDKKNRKVGIDNVSFYRYNDQGRITEGLYCSRNCEFPVKEIYMYDSLGRLEITKVITNKNEKLKSTKYYYGKNNLLAKKITGAHTNQFTEEYAYNKANLKSIITTKAFNNNLNKWLTTVDSLFYDKAGNLILKNSHIIGEREIYISRYAYINKLLTTQTDTMLYESKTTILPTNTFYQAHYSKTDYKYNSDRKLIEEITTQPDYKTPAYKTTYTYTTKHR